MFSDNPSSSFETTNYLANSNKKLDIIGNSIEFDSKSVEEPIINPCIYHKTLDSEFKGSNDEKMSLKLIHYDILKQSILKCSSFPSSKRKFIYQYLFSLPNDQKIYNSLKKKGVHPFYRFLDSVYPLQDKIQRKNLQNVCSLLSHFSPFIGDIYFLPEIVFPFIKCFPNEEQFIFELIIAFFNSIGNYWFQYHPSCPLKHIKLAEKMIQKEDKILYDHINRIQKECKEFDIKIGELIWRLMRTLFSESVCRGHWQQIIDFLFLYNHKPEMILYFSAAYIMSCRFILLKSKNSSSIRNVLFEISENTIISKVFRRTIDLYNKYNQYQIEKYNPYVPFYNLDERKFINNIDSLFPKDYIEYVTLINDEMSNMDKEYKEKMKTLDKKEKEFNDLLYKEESKQREILCLMHKEHMKEHHFNDQLDIGLLQMMRYNEEINKKQEEKISKLDKVIKESEKAYENMVDVIFNKNNEFNFGKQMVGLIKSKKFTDENINDYQMKIQNGLKYLERLRQEVENQIKPKNTDTGEFTNYKGIQDEIDQILNLNNKINDININNNDKIILETKRVFDDDKQRQNFNEYLIKKCGGYLPQSKISESIN